MCSSLNEYKPRDSKAAPNHNKHSQDAETMNRWYEGCSWCILPYLYHTITQFLFSVFGHNQRFHQVVDSWQVFYVTFEFFHHFQDTENCAFGMIIAGHLLLGRQEKATSYCVLFLLFGTGEHFHDKLFQLCSSLWCYCYVLVVVIIEAHVTKISLFKKSRLYKWLHLDAFISLIC